MKKILTILVIAGILMLSVGFAGCAQKVNNNSQKYSVSADPVVFGVVDKTNEIKPEKFEIQMKEFYEFSQEFFSIWDDHIETVTPFLDEFNNENTILEDKIDCSVMISEEYKKFNNNLKQITPPPEALKAYQYIINAVSKRILFFEEFEKGTGINTLIEIEKEAYSFERLFWNEIDNIYNHYIEEIDKKNIISA
jgi:hypothetical protein